MEIGKRVEERLRLLSSDDYAFLYRLSRVSLFNHPVSPKSFSLADSAQCFSFFFF